MSKETAFVIAAFILTIALVVGLAFLFSAKDQKVSSVSTTAVQGMEASPPNYDFGSVPINGGIVTRQYEVKNTSGGDMELLKIATSCMCTTASAKVGDKETRFFGMEMSGDKNPFVNLKVKNGETAKITVRFDPAAHGPQGVGPFDRIVWLYFNGGVKELTFKGTVVQ